MHGLLATQQCFRCHYAVLKLILTHPLIVKHSHHAKTDESVFAFLSSTSQLEALVFHLHKASPSS